MPWDVVKGGTAKHNEQRIIKKKREWTARRLCEGHPAELAVLLDYVRNLEFDETPDYSYMKGRLLETSRQEKYDLDKPFEWSGLERSMLQGSLA